MIVFAFYICTENIVQVLKTVIRASEENSGHGPDDPFWENALDMLIFHVIDLCLLAYGKVSIEKMYDIVMSAPKRVDNRNQNHEYGESAFSKAMKQAKLKTQKDVEDWIAIHPEQSKGLAGNQQLFDMVLTDEVPSVRLIKFIDNFFIDSYRTIGEKTRSLIDFCFSGFLFRLLRDPVYSLFCKIPSTVTPEDCLDGKIILLNLPVKLYNKVGRDAQILYKFIWQQSMEKRDIKQNDLPVFLWADEAQHFLHSHDRSTRRQREAAG